MMPILRPRTGQGAARSGHWCSWLRSAAGDVVATYGKSAFATTVNGVADQNSVVMTYGWPGTRSGGRDSTADPRLHNPYFGGETPNAARMPRQTSAPDLVRTTPT